MKKLLILTLAIGVSAAGFSQKGKGKSNASDATKKEARKVILGDETTKTEKKDKGSNGNGGSHNGGAVWGGTSGTGKPSKNQPAKVSQAFAADYPGAGNVSWSKYRGDWTATFNNNGITSTAVYHANGQRKDTRTVVDRPQLPGKIEDIFQKKPATKIGDIIKIDLPGAPNLYRVKTVEGSSTKYTVYNTNGGVVNYDY